MSNSLNLMSLVARRRECIRMRQRQWLLALGIVVLLLSVVTAQNYWSYLSTLQRQRALEAKYEPIGQLKTSNKVLSKQIAAIRHEEEFVLTLSKREPTITLLGLLGNAVADGNSRVFLQKIELKNLGQQSAAKDTPVLQIDLDGVANSKTAVNQFADGLKASAPFGKIEVTSTEEYQLKQQTMQNFSLECSF